MTMFVWVCLILAASVTEICCVTEAVKQSGKVLGGGPNSQGQSTATKAQEGKSTTTQDATNKATGATSSVAITPENKAAMPKKTIKDVRAMMVTEAKSILMCCAEYIPKGEYSGMCSYDALRLFDLSKRKEFHEKMNLGSPEKLDVVYKSVLERLKAHNTDLNWNDEKNKDIVKALTKEVLDVVKQDMEHQFLTPDEIATGMKNSMNSLGTQPKKLDEGQYWGYIKASCFPKEYQPFHPRNEAKERNEDETYFDSIKKALTDATKNIWNMWGVCSITGICTWGTSK